MSERFVRALQQAAVVALEGVFRSDVVLRGDDGERNG